MHSPPYLYRFCVQETLAVKSETSQRQLVRAGVKVTGKVFKMQAFVHTNQKKLKEFLDEAAEWDRARSDTRMEAETDWELVCRIAEGSCCHGEVCSYMEAVTAFLRSKRGLYLSEQSGRSFASHHL